MDLLPLGGLLPDTGSAGRGPALATALALVSALESRGGYRRQLQRSPRRVGLKIRSAIDFRRPLRQARPWQRSPCLLSRPSVGTLPQAAGAAVVGRQWDAWTRTLPFELQRYLRQQMASPRQIERHAAGAQQVVCWSRVDGHQPSQVRPLAVAARVAPSTSPHPGQRRSPDSEPTTTPQRRRSAVARAHIWRSTYVSTSPTTIRRQMLCLHEKAPIAQDFGASAWVKT